MRLIVTSGKGKTLIGGGAAVEGMISTVAIVSNGPLFPQDLPAIWSATAQEIAFNSGDEWELTVIATCANLAE